MCTCEHTGSISCDSPTPGQKGTNRAKLHLGPSVTWEAWRTAGEGEEERLLEGEQRAVRSRTGQAGTLDAVHHQPNHPQSHPIQPNSNHPRAGPSHGREAPGPLTGTGILLINNNLPFLPASPQSRGQPCVGSQGMLAAALKSLRSVTLHRFTWVQFLLWGTHHWRKRYTA